MISEHDLTSDAGHLARRDGTVVYVTSLFCFCFRQCRLSSKDCENKVLSENQPTNYLSFTLAL